MPHTIHPDIMLIFIYSFVEILAYPIPHTIQDWVIQQDTFITVLAAIISGARNGVEKPIPFRIPSVAAPQPNKVNGPLNNPSGARVINMRAITSVLFGIMPLNNTLKYGIHNSAALLNIGITNKKPTSGAVSTTPSKKSLLRVRQALVKDLSLPQTNNA